MAGTFPGVSNTQQHDLSGQPLAGAQLFVYIGGTSILAPTYQDIGLALAASNPLIATADGRIPLFFVADGTYRVRLVDSSGAIDNGGFDYPQVPSIGASSGGGGGSAVDPTTVLSTGDMKWTLDEGILAGFVRCNARTMGNALSGGSELASPTAQALFVWIYNRFSDGECPVSGGRTGNALNDFNANKTITIPDLRGVAIFGNTAMGNADNGFFAGIAFTTRGAIAPYGKFGATKLTIDAGNVPVMPVSISTSVSTTVSTTVGTTVSTAVTTGVSTSTTVTTSTGITDTRVWTYRTVNGSGNFTNATTATSGSSGVQSQNPTIDVSGSISANSSSGATSTSVATSTAVSTAVSTASSGASSTAVSSGSANPGSPNNPIDKTPPGVTVTFYLKL